MEHRETRGGISTDREHPGLQRAMLEAEGVVFDADGHIDPLAPGGDRGGRLRVPKLDDIAARLSRCMARVRFQNR